MNPNESADNHTDWVYPVILSVPENARPLKGREQVKLLSRYARKALEVSAQKRGIRLEKLLKDPDGVPLPFDGCYWSLTHKPEYVGAVVAYKPTGIDIERIKEVSAALIQKIAISSEWQLSERDPQRDFFRFWTAKEAVLKAVGVGMKGLSKCRIRRILDQRHMVVDYEGKSFTIEHFQFDGYIAAVVENGFRVEWTVDKCF
jgi:4'-phosphopantetheinyl transferase